jgi:hypothetical protein
MVQSLTNVMFTAAACAQMSRTPAVLRQPQVLQVVIQYVSWPGACFRQCYLFWATPVVINSSSNSAGDAGSLATA